ncbi:MAG: hypothetical protein HND46_02005 [Chloroflexi bacterium]|nr:hypothetical protein [Chloroflexota bacterium]NOG62168.1 hypothetical protein [Chloroflexota bacterium]
MATILMTGIALLLTFSIALSVFNIALLLWLGLTIFLSAERRSEGLYLILAGMLLGALFFTSHAIILTSQFTPSLEPYLNFWWYAGWLPVVSIPLLWYLVILWYTGWPKRHRIPTLILGLFSLALLILLMIAKPLPSYTEVILLNLQHADLLDGIPLMFVFYPPYILACIILPFDALLHPMPSQRMLGDLARERSRPFLLAVSILLLAVTVLVAGFLVLVLYVVEANIAIIDDPLTSPGVVVLDFGLTTLISIAIIFLGRAVVSYEIFTGKTLPRRGLLRHWRNAMILAWGIATFISIVLVIQPPPIYSLMFLAAINMAFYALISWRSFVHRDYLISHLRPFVTTPRLLQNLTEPAADAQASIRPLFEIVCRDMLNTRTACLIPLGRLAPLVGKPLFYPPSANITLPTIIPSSITTGSGLRPINTIQGFDWAVPLWAERGLIGVLLLGPKADDGLYAQEEIDAASASAERIIDLLAGEEMGRRLIELQRQRQSENRLNDLRTRRVLHDEILPTIHLAALQTSAAARTTPNLRPLLQTLTDIHGQIAELIHSALQPPPIAPTAHFVEGLRSIIEHEFTGVFAEIRWRVDGTPSKLKEDTQEILIHAVREVVRNAAIHGQRDAKVCLDIHIIAAGRLCVEVTDNGVGPQHLSGNSTEGSGNGLALHSTLLAIVGGELALEPVVSGGTRVSITVPIG